MGLEHERIADQIRGQLSGAEANLEVAWRELMEAEAKQKKCAEAVDELRLILEHHNEAVTA